MKRPPILVLTVLLAGCGGWSGFGPAPGPETRSLGADLPPLERPSRSEFRNMKVQSLIDGETRTITIARFGNGLRIRDSDGCVTTRVLDWFSPSDSFAFCSSSQNWRTAQARVKVLDPLYPLDLGAEGVYWRRAVSGTGRISERESRCEVVDTVEVVRDRAPTVPAFVVECDDGRLRRTTWYSPGIGPVAYREIHEDRGVREAWVRID